MKQYSLLLSLSFCWLIAKTAAQPSGMNLETSNAEWQKAAGSIQVLKNDENLLPFKDLGCHTIYWHTFGLEAGNAFEETMEKYATRPTLPAIGGPGEVHVFALNAAAYKCGNPGVAAFVTQLDSCLRSSKVVAVIFGDTAVLRQLPSCQRAQAWIAAPGPGDTDLSLAAQTLFGGTPGPHHLRLGYASPAAVGVDAQLLGDSITAIVAEGIRAHAYPGAQVLVAKDGQVIFHRAYGFHTYDSLQAVRTTDIYDFASVTKVTSTLPALMKFYGEGRFDLDAPLKKYLPFFKRGNKANITYREFLAHYGRLKPSIVFWKRAQKRNGKWKCRSFKNHYSRRYSVRITDSLYLFTNYKKKILKGIRSQPLNEERAYVYSDLSFILYPQVVERLSGQPLEAFLKDTFYRPLGANTLTYNPLRFFPKERIVPTERDTFFRKIQVHGTVHDETAAMLGGVSGHAGLFGSANDLAKLFQMYMNFGKYGGERFIAENAVREFTQCQYCSEGNRRGLGFDKPPIEYVAGESYVARSASPASFGHSGYTGTFVWADPAQNLLVIFFSNRVYPGRSSRGLYELNIRPRLHQAIYDAIRE
ncbi:MAG: serine hydrolase domain-containing protein [Saprospiraceae bacterium]